MLTPNYPKNEIERLKAVRKFDLIDSLPEEEYDNIALIASLICQTPISLISIVDENRQFFKSHIGLEISATSREVSFCAHSLNTPEDIFEIEDARKDERFHDNPLVIGNPNIVFYAGMPIVTNNGYALGTICVIDNKPHILSEEQREGLRRLSKQVMYMLEIREKRLLEERFKLVDFAFRNASLPVVIVREDASFYDFNESACEHLGYTREELLQMKTLDLDKDYDLLKWHNHWEELKLNGNVTLETKLKRKDGSYIDVIINANYINYGHQELICSFVQDITKKKQEELRLKLMELAILNTNDSIVITEAEPISEPGPKIVFVNQSYTDITGYNSEEAIGRSPRMLQFEETDRKELAKFRTSLEKWEQAEMTVLNKNKNGEKFWVNIVARPVADEKGWFTHWIGVQRDVTKEKEAEMEKEKLINELIRNNKELTQFSYITTHNLRAPLTNLISICQLINTDKITDPFTLKLIEGFKSSTALLNDTLNDLIKILIIKENVSIPTNELFFQETFDKIKTSLSNTLLDEKVTIHSDFSKAASVSFNNIYLDSIFINLISNSIKYRHPDRYPIIEIKTIIDENNRVNLTFRDNGIGMNIEKVRDKIFGLHQRFHRNANGRGVGLYLIHSQITALGSNIVVDSKEDVGTTFTIIFK